MGNKVKGQVTRTIGGRAYIFELSANALCELEDLLDMAVTKFAARAAAEDLGMRELRALFWAALIEHQEQITLKEAGRLMSQVGDMAAQSEFLGDLFSAAMPDVDAEGDAAPGKSPAAA